MPHDRSIISYGSRRPPFSPKNVFSQEHMNLYIAWIQQEWQLATNHADAPFPTWREFNAFIRSQGPRYPQAIHPCQHTRHPYDNITISEKYCPVCYFKMHSNYLKFLDVARERMGVDERETEEYMQAINARHFARMEFANFMSFVEGMAEREIKWNKDMAFCSTDNTYSYLKVMQMYQMWLDPRPDPPRISPSPAKAVVFVDDTADFTVEKSRTRDQYCRRTPIYSAGKHACSSKEGWLNTSESRSKTRSLLQCKLFIAESRADIADADISHRNANYVGLLYTYAYHSEVINHIAEDIKKATDKNQAMEQLNASDAILLLNPENMSPHGKKYVTFKEVRLFCFEDDETPSWGSSQWGVQSDPSAFESDEMIWE